MAIYPIEDIQVLYGEKGMSIKYNKLCADAVNSTDDIHPQYLKSVLNDNIHTYRMIIYPSGESSQVNIFGLYTATKIALTLEGYSDTYGFARETFKSYYSCAVMHHTFIKSVYDKISITMDYGTYTYINSGTARANINVLIYKNGVLVYESPATTVADNTSAEIPSLGEAAALPSFSEFSISNVVLSNYGITNGSKVDVIIKITPTAFPLPGDRFFVYCKNFYAIVTQ
jgi:hypothetical protein